MNCKDKHKNDEKSGGFQMNFGNRDTTCIGQTEIKL